MPTQTARLHDGLRRAVEGEAWHGPHLRLALDGVTPGIADARLAGGVHTIHELVLHMAAWLGAVERRVRGEAVTLAEAENFPTPGRWEDAVARVEAAYAALARAVAGLDDDALEARVPGDGWTAYESVHGAVQHTLYHAGQIALLRRALGHPVAQG